MDCLALPKQPVSDPPTSALSFTTDPYYHLQNTDDNEQFDVLDHMIKTDVSDMISGLLAFGDFYSWSFVTCDF